MKLSMLTTTVVALFGLLGAAYADPAVPPQRKGPSAKKLAKRAEYIAKNGGLVSKPLDGKVIRIVNAQTKVPVGIIEETRASIEKEVRLYVEIVPGKSEETYRPDEKAGAVVVLREAGSVPTLLIAPEDGWAEVNVSKLNADGPKQDVLNARVQKELWRALGISLGASNSRYQPCLMRQINSLKDLDSNSLVVPSPEPFDSIRAAGLTRGVSECVRMTYRRACEEGWAAKPTNDVQKAVWESVHALPTQPMKILPESQRKAPSK